MSLYIEKDGKTYQVPREVEAKGGAAIEGWVAEQAAAKPAKKKTSNQE